MEYLRFFRSKLFSTIFVLSLAIIGSFLWSYPTSADPYFPVKPMQTARALHAAALLNDGRVLVTGGVSNGNSETSLNSAELYDPTNDTWAQAAPLAYARSYHTETVLLDGRVLVVGGVNSRLGAALASVEIYDPTNNTWSSGPPLAQGRSLHTATILIDGRVLVAGGGDRYGNRPGAEIYDPAANKWASAGNLNTPRMMHTASILGNGGVLIAGGVRDGGISSAEIYTPASNNWTSVTPMAYVRYMHDGFSLQDGRVIEVGGWGATPNGGNPPLTPTSEIYDSASNQWTKTADLKAGRSGFSITRLFDGRILIGGGYGGNNVLVSTEIFDPSANSWQYDGNFTMPREYHTATLLKSGKVLVVGGFVSTSTPAATASAEER